MNELKRQHVLLYVLIPILLVLGDISIHGLQEKGHPWAVLESLESCVVFGVHGETGRCGRWVGIWTRWSQPQVDNY